MLKDKQKILVLSSSYPRWDGDANGTFVHNQVSKLSKSYDMHVLIPSYKELPLYEELGNIKIYRFKQFFSKNVELAYGIDIMAKIKKNYFLLFVVPFFMLYQFLAIKKIVAKEKIRTIHAHWLIPQGFLAVCYKSIFNRKMKILVTIHGADLNSFDNYAGNLLKTFILKRIDSLAVVSQPMKDRVIELGYKKEVYVLPAGVDTKVFAPNKKDESLKTKNAIDGYFLLFVGSLIERKGIKDLIYAMPKILEDFSDAKLLVAGDGHLKDELMNLVKKLKISTNVIFTGSIPHDDLAPYFATADIFILPSYSEGWPVVVMEALSSGTPPVVSNIPVFTKHEDRNDLFTIIDKGDSTSIANSIIGLLCDKKALDKRKKDLRLYAINNLDLNVIANKYKNILSELAV